MWAFIEPLLVTRLTRRRTLLWSGAFKRLTASAAAFKASDDKPGKSINPANRGSAICCHEVSAVDTYKFPFTIISPAGTYKQWKNK